MYKRQADLFLSIHAVALPDSARRGLSVFTLSAEASDREAAALARSENREIVDGVNLGRHSHDVGTVLFDLARRQTDNLSLALGRDHQYAQFQIPIEHRVRRFVEGVALIRALWSGREVDYRGTIFRCAGEPMLPQPVQQPSLPIWLGVGHPNALRRAARIADGWMGAGGSSTAAFAQAVPILRAALEKAGRDPTHYPISKPVFIAVDERPEAARAELDRWFTTVYHNPAGTDAAGIHGTPEQVAERLQQLVAMGANHLLLNPVSRDLEQLEALAAVVGLA